jgi:hypothetical protein
MKPDIHLNRKLFLCFLLFLVLTNMFSEQVIILNDGRKVILFDDFTWRYVEQEKTVTDYSAIKDNEAPPFLRQGTKAARQEIITAIEMYNQGWRYMMPRPKSAQAAWGNSDGRTTWWYGWWYNEKTGLYSDSTPRKSENGLYLGDNQNNAHQWRNGGSRGRPDIYMYLLSENGGPPQR